MVVIKKQQTKAYILLESLVALAILTMIVSLVLGEVNRDRAKVAENLHRQEVLNLAQMAVQTKQNHLSLDGITVSVVRSDREIRVYEAGKEVLHVTQY